MSESQTNKISKVDLEKAVTTLEKTVEERSENIQYAINMGPPKLVRQTNIGLSPTKLYGHEDITSQLFSLSQNTKTRNIECPPLRNK